MTSSLSLSKTAYVPKPSAPKPAVTAGPSVANASYVPNSSAPKPVVPSLADASYVPNSSAPKPVVPSLADASYVPNSSAPKPAVAIGPASINDALLDFYGEDPENAIKVGAARLSDLKFSEAGYLEGKQYRWIKSAPTAQVQNFKLGIMSDKQRALLVQTPCFVPQSMLKAWGLGNWMPLEKRPTDAKSQEWVRCLPKKKSDSSFEVNISMHPYCEAAQVKTGPFEGLNVHMVQFIEQLVLLTVDGVKRLMYEHPAMFTWLPDWRKSTKLKRADIEAMPALKFFELIRPFINFKLTKTDNDAPAHAQKEGAHEEGEEEIIEDAGPFDYVDFVRRLIFTLKSRCFFSKKEDDAYVPYPNPKYAEIEATENCAYSPFPVEYVVQEKTGKFGLRQLTPEQRCNPQFFVPNIVCRAIGTVSIAPNNNSKKTKVGMTISKFVFVCKSDIPLAARELKIEESDEAADFNRRLQEKIAERRRKAEEDASTNQIAEEEEDDTAMAKRKLAEEKHADLIQEALEASNGVNFDEEEEEEVPVEPTKRKRIEIPSLEDEEGPVEPIKHKRYEIPSTEEEEVLE